MTADVGTDGGAAFPQTVQGWNGNLTPGQHGMTLRDWFAGQALIAYAHPDNLVEARDAAADMGMSAVAFIAACAYEQADAMLAARGSSNGG